MELVQQKWLSLLNHVVNIQEGHGDKFPRCLHEEIEDRDWMLKGITGYGWMDYLRFYIFFTIFQSYQDDEWLVMKGCMQKNSVYGQKDLCLQRDLNLGPLDQQTST